MGQQSVVHVYTDGSCSPNPGDGGWAVVLIDPASGYRKEISGAERSTTNNRMELLAAIKALQALKKPCSVVLHTDSKYLSEAFTQNWIPRWVSKGWRTSNKKPVKNVDLWQVLIELTDRHDVRWEWLKGHSIHSEINRCDYLANVARRTMLPPEVEPTKAPGTQLFDE